MKNLYVSQHVSTSHNYRTGMKVLQSNEIMVKHAFVSSLIAHSITKNKISFDDTKQL